MKMVNEFSTTEIFSQHLKLQVFFSRLSLKKRKMSNTDYEENDLTAEGNMNNLNQISDVALKAVK